MVLHVALFLFFSYCYGRHRDLHSFPTRRSSDLSRQSLPQPLEVHGPQRAVVEAVAGASALAPDHAPMIRAHRPRDRKSTRLNSSHANISYAVFCLKKKKTRE